MPASHAWLLVSCLSLQLLSLTSAQSLGSLPACGQVCINNCLALGASLGCPTEGGSPNATCLCNNDNFGYCIRDCSEEACSTSTEAQAIIQYGLSYCEAAGDANGAAVTALDPSTTLASTSKSTSKATAASTTGSHTSATKTGSSTRASSASSTRSPGSASASPSTTSVPTHGLSSGAKVGIGVGVGVGGALLLALLAALLIFRRRRRDRNADGTVSKKPSKKRWDKPELEDSALPRTHGRAELEGSRRATPVPGESGAKHEELAGNGRLMHPSDEKETVHEIGSGYAVDHSVS